MPAKLDIKIRKISLKLMHPEELAAMYGCSVSYVLKLRAASGVTYSGPRKPGSGNKPTIKLTKLDPSKSLAQNAKRIGLNPKTGRPYSRSGVAAALKRAAGCSEPDFL